MKDYVGEQRANTQSNLSNIPQGVTLTDMANPPLTIQTLRARVSALEAALREIVAINDDTIMSDDDCGPPGECCPCQSPRLRAAMDNAEAVLTPKFTASETLR